MKKVSTAAKQIRNFSEQKLTIGLDLGDRSSYYCVLDETGHIVVEQKVSTTPKALQAAFGAIPRSLIALETGMHSPWVSRLLSGLGHETIVAHARNVRLIGESRRKMSEFFRSVQVGCSRRVRMEGWRQGRLGIKKESCLTKNILRRWKARSTNRWRHRLKRKTHLTPTGLLMEGDFTQNCSSQFWSFA